MPTKLFLASVIRMYLIDDHWSLKLRKRGIVKLVLRQIGDGINVPANVSRTKEFKKNTITLKFLKAISI